MPRTALFAGSFDPITNGHLDVVSKAVKLADKLVLAVGIHPGKTPLFSAEERLAMLDEICAPLGRAAGCTIVCTTFADLVVTAAQREGATILVRGVRDATDFLRNGIADSAGTPNPLRGAIKHAVRDWLPPVRH